MGRHLTDEEIEEYGTGGRTPAASGFPVDHLHTCPSCRSRLERSDARALEHMARATFFPENTGSRHPPLEVMLAYARGAADEIDREVIEGHLEDCPECQADLEVIRTFREGQFRIPPHVYAPDRASSWLARIRNWKPAPPLSFIAPLAGVAAVAVILAIRATAPSDHPEPGPRETRPVAAAPKGRSTPGTAARPADASLPGRDDAPRKAQSPMPSPVRTATVPRPNDGRRVIPPRPVPPPSPDRPAGPKPAVSRDQTAPEKPSPEAPTRLASLPEQPTDIPAWARADLERIMERPPVFRSSGLPGPAAIRLLTPDPGNRAVVETSPAFTWDPVDGAESYEVRLERDEGDATREMERANVTEPRYEPRQPLERGRRYNVTISALRPAGEEPIWQPAEVTIRFRVLTADEARQAGWAVDHVGRTPITSAMVLYRLGLFHEAERLTARWPPGRYTRGWADAIRQARARRIANPAR